MSARPSSLLARWASRAADARTAVVDARGASSWRDVVAGADAVAAELLRGRPSLAGARVALLASPGAAFVTSFFGVLRAGGAVVPLSPLHPQPELRRMCDDAAVEAVVASAVFSDRVAALGAPVVDADVARPSVSPPPARPSDDDDALQLYTSGTTGKPKGAVLTHANLAVQQQLLARRVGSRAETTCCSTRCRSITCTGSASRCSRPSAAARPCAAWIPARFDGAAHLGGDGATPRSSWPCPRSTRELFAAFDAADDATRARWTAHARALRLATSGSAALPVTLGERWRAVTGAYPLERFGMTEIGVGMTQPARPSARRPGTVGLPLPGGRDADRRRRRARRRDRRALDPRSQRLRRLPRTRPRRRARPSSHEGGDALVQDRRHGRARRRRLRSASSGARASTSSRAAATS